VARGASRSLHLTDWLSEGLAGWRSGVCAFLPWQPAWGRFAPCAIVWLLVVRGLCKLNVWAFGVWVRAGGQGGGD
jgi:hypothetical protein